MAATLLQLRNRVLVVLNDLQDPVTGTGDRYRTVNLNQTINDVMHHYERMLNQFYQGYLNQNLDIDVLANISSYDLGATFRSPIYQVRRTIQNVNYYLDYFQTYNGILDTTSVSNSIWLPTYQLEGNKIVFCNAPDTDELAAVTVKSQKKLTDLSIDTDQLDDQMYDAEDCIVLRAASRQLKSKDVSGGLKGISGWDKEVMDSEKIFMTQVGKRYVKPDQPIAVQHDIGYIY